MPRIQPANQKVIVNIIPNNLLGAVLSDRLRRAKINSAHEEAVFGLLKFAVEKLKGAGIQIDETVLTEPKKQTRAVITALMNITKVNEKTIKDALTLSVEASEDSNFINARPLDPKDAEDISEPRTKALGKEKFKLSNHTRKYF